MSTPLAMSTRQAPPVSPAARVSTVAAVVVVALVAAVVSFSHMQTVAERAGEAWRSWLVPLSVDGLVVAASMVLLTRRRAGLAGGWLPWTALLGGVGASLAANMAAADPSVTARLVAAWPAVAFAVAFELLLQQRRADPAVTGQSGRPGVAEPPTAVPVTAPVGPPYRTVAPVAVPVAVRPDPVAPVRSDPGPAVRPDPVAAVRSAVRPADRPGGSTRTAPPERSADRSEPARPVRPSHSTRNGAVRTQAAAPRTDADLSRAVRELAERTGGPPSQYQLKTRFGIGSSRAGRLLAELAETTTAAGDPGRNAAARKEAP